MRIVFQAMALFFGVSTITLLVLAFCVQGELRFWAILGIVGCSSTFTFAVFSIDPRPQPTAILEFPAGEMKGHLRFERRDS